MFCFHNLQTLLVTGNTDVSIAAVVIAVRQCARVFASSELINIMSHTSSKQDIGVKTSLHMYTEVEDVFRHTKGIGMLLYQNLYLITFILCKS